MTAIRFQKIEAKRLRKFGVTHFYKKHWQLRKNQPYQLILLMIKYLNLYKKVQIMKKT